MRRFRELGNWATSASYWAFKEGERWQEQNIRQLAERSFFSTEDHRAAPPVRPLPRLFSVRTSGDSNTQWLLRPTTGYGGGLYQRLSNGRPRALVIFELIRYSNSLEPLICGKASRAGSCLTRDLRGPFLRATLSHTTYSESDVSDAIKKAILQGAYRIGGTTREKVDIAAGVFLAARNGCGKAV